MGAGGSSSTGRGDEVEAAIVFVDLVKFTALTDVHGDEAAADAAGALAELGRRHAGEGTRLVKSLGDGILLQAPAVPQALRLAGDVIEGLHELGLDATAGIDHGAIVVRSGDVFGSTVNLASRLASLAAPGTVAVTRPVALTAGDAGLAATPLGAKRLRGVLEPVEVFQVDPCRHGSDWLIDPVCGMRMEQGSAILPRHHGDRRLGFCSTTCAEIFAADPERFAPGAG